MITITIVYVVQDFTLRNYFFLVQNFTLRDKISYKSLFIYLISLISGCAFSSPLSIHSNGAPAAQSQRKVSSYPSSGAAGEPGKLLLLQGAMASWLPG